VKFDKTAIVGGGLLLVAAIILVIKLSLSGPPEAPSDPTTQSAPRAENGSRPVSKIRPVPSPDLRPGANATETPELSSEEIKAARDAAIEKIQEASTSYDPAELPVIRPYLESRDPDLRAAAVDAMIVLGDASAGPMLREAARKLESPEEAKAMEQAADYIELPSANLKQISETLKKRKEAKRAAIGQEAGKPSADEVK